MSSSASESPYSFSGSDDDDNLSFAAMDYDISSSDSSVVVSHDSTGHNSDSFGGSDNMDIDDGSVEVGFGDLMYALYPFQKPKRVRGIRRKLPVVPRLIQSDIRRKYFTMLLNVLNSHDPLQMQPFVEQYLTPTVTLIKPAVKTAVMVKPSTFVEGADALIRYWSMLSVIIPDQTFQAENVRLVRNSKDDSCKIVCDLVSSCTQLYDHQLSARSLLSTPANASHVEIKEVPDGVEYLSRKKQRLDVETAHHSYDDLALSPMACPPHAVNYGPLYLRLLPHPVKVQMVTKLTLHVDTMQRIASLEYGNASLVY